MVKEIKAKSILLYNKRPASWFGVHYYINIYRGCTHGCIYCDSRSECYGIDNFDDEISVKVNAIDLLKESVAKKRTHETIGFGSTSDPYVGIEKKYELTRQALIVAKDFFHPVFILTKSDLVIRDLDLLTEINNRNYACVAFTITTADDDLAKFIEPGAPLPSKRFRAMSILSAMGIKTGVNIMPMIPFLTDSKDNLENIFKKAREAGASFVFPSYSVTLRDRQRDYFLNKLDPSLKQKYILSYKNYYNCVSFNYKDLKRCVHELAIKYQISMEMPSYDKENSASQLNFPI